MTDLELGYVAGFFDGEGSITIQKKSNNRVTVRIGSTDLDMVEKILSFTGIGSIDNPRQLKSGKLFWRWHLWTQEDTLYFLKKIYPLVSARRQMKAQEGIDILESKEANSQKICWYCQTEFVSFIISAKCCSKFCSDKYQYYKRTGARVEPRTLLCPACEQIFSSTQPFALCCSKRCEAKNRNSNAPNSPCLNCGGPKPRGRGRKKCDDCLGDHNAM